MDNKSPIGIFDSGVGGLTVVNNMVKILPKENIIYFADSKNFPYGIKTEEEVIKLSERIVKFLISKGAKVIVVACNTVSSIAIPHLKGIAGEIPVFGMIQAGAMYAVKTSKNKRIGIISTPLTARKHAYYNEIKKIEPDAEIFEVGSEEMVTLVEDGISYEKYAYRLVEEKLKAPIEDKIDTLVLGCTHFPFLYKTVKAVVGEKIKVIDPSDFLVFEVKKYLESKGLLKKDNHIKKFYFTSGEKKEFKEKMKIFLDYPSNNITKINI
jgi:glutamate racemase